MPRCKREIRTARSTFTRTTTLWPFVDGADRQVLCRRVKDRIGKVFAALLLFRERITAVAVESTCNWSLDRRWTSGRRLCNPVNQYLGGPPVTSSAWRPTRLRNGVKRHADLCVGGTLPVIGLDFRPSHRSLSVEYEDGRMGNAFEFLTRIRRVSQSVPIDRSACRIGEKRERNLSLSVRLNLLQERARLLARIRTDCQNGDRLALLGQITQPGNLPGTVWSPGSAIEDQHDLAPAKRRELQFRAGLISQRERRRLLSNCRERGGGSCHTDE